MTVLAPTSANGRQVYGGRFIEAGQVQVRVETDPPTQIAVHGGTTDHDLTNLSNPRKVKPGDRQHGGWKKPVGQRTSVRFN